MKVCIRKVDPLLVFLTDDIHLNIHVKTLNTILVGRQSTDDELKQKNKIPQSTILRISHRL